METENRKLQVLEEQIRMQRAAQVTGRLAVVQVDNEFFTREWEAQGHPFGD